jgi:hypothetical protein
MDAVPRRIDPEVYLLDLRGRHFWHQRTETGFRSALRLFEDAAGAIRPMRPPTLGSPSRLICWPTTACTPAGNPAALARRRARARAR